jgi:hypothetical protein
MTMWAPPSPKQDIPKNMLACCAFIIYIAQGRNKKEENEVPPPYERPPKNFSVF